jgi:helicase
VASTPDVLGLYPKKADAEVLKEIIDEYEGYFLVEEPDDHSDYVYFLSDLKVAYLISEWINEVDEETITEVLGIGPGDIRARVETVEWILHSMNELSVIFRPECMKKLKPLLTRVRYGIKGELTELVAFRGVGRSRARTLYNAGVKNRQDIADTDINKIAGLPRVGMSLAKSLKEQVGSSGDSKDRIWKDRRDEDKKDEEDVEKDNRKQTGLSDFG